MDFQSHFHKVIWVVGGTFFCHNFCLKKPNNQEYAQVLVVTCPKPNSVIALLFPPPPRLEMFNTFIQLKIKSYISITKKIHFLSFFS